VYGGASSTQSTEQSTVSAAHSPQSTEHMEDGGGGESAGQRAGFVNVTAHSTQHTAATPLEEEELATTRSTKPTTYSPLSVLRSSLLFVVFAAPSALSPLHSVQASAPQLLPLGLSSWSLVYDLRSSQLLSLRHHTRHWQPLAAG
jgi:hypothetical protein